MPRIKSEIWEQYCDIANQCGLTDELFKTAAEESAELKKYKDDPEARVGSDDISTIEALYGVKPDGQDYELNIMQDAHPNSVIIAPSYDKINGLVENEIERHNISRNLVEKVPTGNLTNTKLASKDLMLELVKIANEMDVRNQTDLCKLADSCIAELSACQRQVKIALAPLAIVGIAAAVLGAGWLLSHTDNVDNGPLANIDSALEALEDLKTNSWYESDVDKTVQDEANVLSKHITELKKAVIEFNNVADLVYKPRTLSEIKELSKLKQNAENNGDQIVVAVNKFKTEVYELEPLLTQAIDNFSSSTYQKMHSTPSSVSKMTGWLGEALHGRWGLVANDFTSAVNALNPLKSSIEELTNRLENMDKVQAKFKKDIQNATLKVGLNVSEDEKSSSKENLNSTKSEQETNDYASLIKSITGKDPEGLDFLQHLKNS